MGAAGLTILFRVVSTSHSADPSAVKFLLGLLFLTLVSCGTKEPLSVRQFHLQDTEVSRDYYRSKKENRLIRGEINKRVHGAVTLEERNARKGRYYTVSWNNLQATESGIRIVFDYRQGKSGARVKTLEQTFPHSSSGKTEFQVIGPAYEEGGDVVAWRISLYEGSRLVSVKRSYLWN